MPYQPWRATSERVNFVAEAPVEDKRLDVAVVSAAAAAAVAGSIEILGAIEVLVTHAIDQEKVDMFCRLQLPWCEVKAVDVLAGAANVRCVRAALTHCAECIDTIRHEVLETRLKKVTDEASRRARNAIEQRVFTERMTELGIAPEDQARLWEVREEHMRPFIRENLLETLQPATLRALEAAVNVDEAIARAEDQWRLYVKRLHDVFEEIPVAELGERIVLWRVSSKLAEMFPEPAEREAARDLIGNAYPEGVLDFGKYKGYTVPHVWDIDRSYVRWLAGYTGQFSEDRRPEEHSRMDNKPHRFRDQARDYLRGHCFLCFADLEVEWHTRCRKCFRQSLEDA